MSTHGTAVKKSERLLKALSPSDAVYVITHDNPDPDAVATGWAVAELVQQRLSKKARLLAGGAIIRAENRHMVDLLQPPIELVSRIACPPNTAVVLVDCQVGTQNHVLSDCSVPAWAVIDHHPRRQPQSRLAFADIRPRVAASASIAASYLREQAVEPGTHLATALVFAIRTETRGSETYYSRLDRSILLWLTERADPSLLAAIESAPLKLDYYGDLILALQNTFLYDQTAFCLLPRASGPEIVAEVADLLIRCEAVCRVVCAAIVAGDLVLSVRTERDEDDAAALIAKMLAGLGPSGGHMHRAGGKVPGTGPKITESLQDELRNRWLDACAIPNKRGIRLVAPKEIRENL